MYISSVIHWWKDSCMRTFIHTHIHETTHVQSLQIVPWLCGRGNAVGMYHSIQVRLHVHSTYSVAVLRMCSSSLPAAESGGNGSLAGWINLAWAWAWAWAWAFQARPRLLLNQFVGWMNKDSVNVSISVCHSVWCACQVHTCVQTFTHNYTYIHAGTYAVARLSVCLWCTLRPLCKPDAYLLVYLHTHT